MTYSTPNPPTGPGSIESHPHKPADDSEQIYFEGTPVLRGAIGQAVLLSLIGVALIALPIVAKVMQWNFNGWVGLLCVVAGVVLIVWPILLTRTVRYRITNYRIDYERGLLSKQIDTLELWHVEDISLHQSLVDRMLGTGDITIVSSDTTTPKLAMTGLPNPRPIFDSLKQRVIAVKRQRGVIKMDL